jgi:hypothetical protein
MRPADFLYTGHSIPAEQALSSFLQAPHAYSSSSARVLVALDWGNHVGLIE